MKRFDAKSGPDSFKAFEEQFIPKHLSDSLRYLRESREPAKGWPRYLGLPSELHSSAVALSALNLVGDQSLGVLLASGTSFIREKFGKNAEPSPEEVIDLLLSANAEKNPDTSYLERLRKILMEACTQTEQIRQEITTQFMSQALMVLQDGKSSQDCAQRWAELLIMRQLQETGGWAVGHDGPTSLTATAWAVRALSSWTNPEGRRAVTSGLDYIQNALKQQSWEDLRDSFGTYSIAQVLRALFAANSTELDMVDSGTLLLRSLMNSDGGWGGGPGERSSIEYTAYSVIALLEGGDNRFIPLRVGLDMFAALESRNREVEIERDKLREDFRRQVDDECGNVVIENEKLSRRLRAMEAKDRDMAKRNREILDLQMRVERRERRALELEYRAISRNSEPLGIAGRNLRVIFLVSLVVSVCSLAAFTYSWGAHLGWLIRSILLAGAVVSATQAGLAWLRLRRIAATRTIEGYSYLTPSAASIYDDLASDFRHITDDMPVPLKEELVYRLLSEGLEIPPGRADRFIRDLMLTLKVPSRESQRLEFWLERLMTLDPDTRRAVILQLRRVIS